MEALIDFEGERGYFKLQISPIQDFSVLSLSSRVAKHTFSSFTERKYSLEPRTFMPNFKLEQIFLKSC